MNSNVSHSPYGSEQTESQKIYFESDRAASEWFGVEYGCGACDIRPGLVSVPGCLQRVSGLVYRVGLVGSGELQALQHS